MLVGERMSHPVIHISPDTSINDTLQLMKREGIRRTPVVEKGKLVGIVSEKDLLNATPSQATTLSVWELNYLLSKITIEDIMRRDIITVTEDTPIEDAARIMADNKIGGLPVMRNDSMVGIISETDLFRLLLELMGAREEGVRVTFMAKDKPGELEKVTEAIAKQGGNILAIGTFAGEDQATREVALKVSRIEEKKLKNLIEPLVKSIKDIRTTKP